MRVCIGILCLSLCFALASRPATHVFNAAFSLLLPACVLVLLNAPAFACCVIGVVAVGFAFAFTVLFFVS